MSIVDLPIVDKLVTEYHFPAYTESPAADDRSGRRRRRAEGHRSPPADHADDEDAGRPRAAERRRRRAPLTVQADGTLTGSFKVDKQGFYKIELDGPQGEKVAASPQYTIDVLTDQTPSVRFGKPGRDTQSTPVEEVFARSAGRRRLRREAGADVLLGERRRREDHRCSAASRCPRSRRATRFISKSSA